LRQVRSEDPGRAGNLFLLDVRNSPGVTRFIESQDGVKGPVRLVGYIISRMVAKNGVAVDTLPLTSRKKGQLRTVRITTATSLPEALEIRKGRWWSAQTDVPQLAVSEDASRYYGLKLGDHLRFEMAGQTVDAPLVAVFGRSSRALVRYDLVFPQAAIQRLPLVYYGAVNVDPRKIPSVEAGLFDRFPTVTVMNLADVMQRIQEAVDQVAVVIRFLALFAIVAGIIILASSVAGTRYRRVREVAILKTVGATKRRITGIFSVEFSVIGAVAGVVGGVLANWFTKVISDKFIDTSFDFDWLSLLLVIIGTVLLANVAGWLASARILDQRPLEVLRGE
jgi:putative ABC transport system permease protein